MVKAILGSIDEAIHVINNEGVTIYYNEMAAKHDGLTIDEVLGKHLLDVFPSLTEKSSTLLNVIKTSQPIYQLPQSYKNIRGVQIDTINTTLPIIVNDNLVGAIEIAKDYSQLKHLSNKLLDLQQKSNKKTKKPNEMNGAQYTMNDILTVNPEFKLVLKQARNVAQTSSTVLVFGETGTGKELLVQSIHNFSSRSHGSFIAQNCAAIPESLLESILFGTVKGSYTGAIDRAGLFELAHGGTLFLDEMNSMPLELQARLLRVLEDGMVRRIGSTKVFKVDVRVIVAMNKHPEECLRDGEIRADLFYRLNVFSLQIPPLKSRKEDIPILIEHFINKFNLDFNKKVTNTDDEFINRLVTYHWPGNVRELKHIVEHAMNMVEGKTLLPEYLPPHFLQHQSTLIHEPSIQPLKQLLEETERKVISNALRITDGNVMRASKLLQIPRQTLQYKMNKLFK